MRRYEDEATANGYTIIAGIDEAGRGPLAGPVVAAAVVLPDDFDGAGLTDSKLLTEKQRELFFDTIICGAIGVASHIAGPEVIDRINILQATRLAMREAALALPTMPDMLLIDGNQPIDWSGRQQTIVKGDSKSLSIAAASIIAKVTRDRLMMNYAKKYPVYGFDRHKGYPVKAHKEAIRRHGPSPIHRVTFKGVREFCHGGQGQTTLDVGGP